MNTFQNSLVGSAESDIIRYLSEDYIFIEGKAGNDLIYSPTYSEDTSQTKTKIDGGLGNDDLRGRDGEDTLIGGRGKDVLYGNGGHDLLNGGFGQDKLYGEQGNDLLYGGYGHDSLIGGAGNDRLHGDHGNDYLTGDHGRDRLHGAWGNDTLVGGDGMDQLIMRRANHDDQDILDFSDTDGARDYLLFIEDSQNTSSMAVVNGFTAEDRIVLREVGGDRISGYQFMDNGSGDTVLSIFHNESDVTSLSFSGLTSDFVESRIILQ